MCGIPEDAIPSVSDNAIGNEFKRTLNRLDVKLTIGSDLIPSSLIIQGVTLLKDTSDRGGAFSDVYEGQSSDGTKVAVKQLGRGILMHVCDLILSVFFFPEEQCLASSPRDWELAENATSTHRPVLQSVCRLGPATSPLRTLRGRKHH